MQQLETAFLLYRECETGFHVVAKRVLMLAQLVLACRNTATMEEVKKGSCSKGKRRELQQIMKQKDYGFAPYKFLVLQQENIETIGALVKRWKAIDSKASSATDYMRESYIYMGCLGKYLEQLCKSQDITEDLVSVWYEEDDFHFQYLKHQFSLSSGH